MPCTLLHVLMCVSHSYQTPYRFSALHSGRYAYSSKGNTCTLNEFPTIKMSSKFFSVPLHLGLVRVGIFWKNIRTQILVIEGGSNATFGPYTQSSMSESRLDLIQTDVLFVYIISALLSYFIRQYFIFIFNLRALNSPKSQMRQRLGLNNEV